MKPRLGTRGTTAVEFAIAISAVLVLVFAIIDVGRLYADQHALDYGIEKAVRYAVVNSTSATAATIKSQLVSAITPVVGATRAAGASVSVTFSPSEKVGATVTVSATLSWTGGTAIDYLLAITLSSSQTLTIQN
jgi:Flp pilus assembly protein TadG